MPLIASVYDPGRGRYRYYRIPHAPAAPRRQPGSPIGTGVNDALPPLPLGSVEVGEGDAPRGPILSYAHRLRPYAKYLALGVGALVVWRIVRG